MALRRESHEERHDYRDRDRDRDYAPLPLSPARSDLTAGMVEAQVEARDRIRWGPVWAGLFTAVTTMILLGMLGSALGLTANPAGDNAPLATLALAWGAGTLLLAFLLGGWVAGRTAGVFDRTSGAWNGALVFMAAVPITLLLAASGLGALVGALGNFLAAFNLSAGDIPAAGLPQVPQAAGWIWGTLAGLVVGLLAATAGGFLGARTHLPHHD